MSRSASVLARPVLASYSRLAVAAMLVRLVAGLADHPLAVLAGLGHHPVGLRPWRRPAAGRLRRASG